MNIEAKKQYMDTLRARYFKAGKKDKGEILNEYCRNTGQERKYAIKKFNYKVKLKSKEDRKKRACFYDGNVIAVLVEIWKIFDYPCGQRLKEILDTETENLRAWKEIVCSDEVADKLKKIKSATIDRRLNHEKEVLKLKEKYRKKVLSCFPPFRLKPALILIEISSAMNKLILWKVAALPPPENISIICLFAISRALGGKAKR